MAEARQDDASPNTQSTKDPEVSSVRSYVNGTDSDAQALLIGSLRGQIQDLFSQVTQLNGKLVSSYDRVSDLEDELHVASSSLRASSLKISQLELERTQHLSALNTGLLVEKSHVTAELNRLMERATEEAAQRGQAESARNAIEKDLDDLSASLFGQANTMVAEARYARALSERKVEEAELALKGAEDAVALMQKQMQFMQEEKERAEQIVEDMKAKMGKGKWIEGRDGGKILTPVRLMSSHLPYQEFLLFVAHLRSLHPSSPLPPAMSTLLPLPFLARLLAEDSDPTVRLDLAPSLNWLSRRSVLAAIHNGQLTIEPMSSTALLQEPMISGITGLNSSSNNISCALCGTSIFDASQANSRGQIWSTALFRRPSSGSPPRPTTPSSSYPPQVYVFRVSTPAASGANTPVLSSFSNHSHSSHPSTSILPQSQPPQHPSLVNNGTQSSSTVYPLCTSGWCLTRLRVTCTLWAFVRTGIVEKVWEEEIPNFPPSPSLLASDADKPPVPPRRRGLWGMASALGERAASWGEEAKKIQLSSPEKKKPLPPIASPTPAKVVAPPPLPRRSVGRGRSGTVTAAPPPPPPPKKLVTEEILEEAEEEESEMKPEPKPEIDLPKREPEHPKADSEPQPKIPLRPSTPSQVPLPESPVVAEFPSRTASPAPGAGGPPPLPRRAAARRSIVGLSSLSRPATPAGDEKTPTPQATLPAEEKPLADAEKPSEQPVLPALNGQVSTIQETEEIETIAEDQKKPELTILEVEQAPEVNGTDVPSTESPLEVNGQKDVLLTNGDSTLTAVDEAKEVYIGDATWEERTWKELVRLKEEMFWARVGGLR